MEFQGCEYDRLPASDYCIVVAVAHVASAQDKKVERIRVGGGSTSATQMSMWFAKEGNLYEKHGLSVEAISIPGSSLALQAMLAGELPIIQLGGAASIQANLAGADTIIIATIVKKFLFWIYGRPEISRMEDLKGKVFGTTRFGTLSDLASRFALRFYGIDPERDITMVQTGGPAETVTAILSGKIHAAALSPPATLQAKKAKLKELLDMSKLDAEYHINGVVTTRRYLKTNEDTVRRFMRAYIEGAARAQKDKTLCAQSDGKNVSYGRSRVPRGKLRHDHQEQFRDPAVSFGAGDCEFVEGIGADKPESQNCKTGRLRRQPYREGAGSERIC